MPPQCHRRDFSVLQYFSRTLLLYYDEAVISKIERRHYADAEKCGAGELARAPLSRLFLPVVPVVSNLKTQGEKRRCARTVVSRSKRKF